jgi:hypothetical protein
MCDGEEFFSDYREERRTRRSCREGDREASSMVVVGDDRDEEGLVKMEKSTQEELEPTICRKE